MTREIKFGKGKVFIQQSLMQVLDRERYNANKALSVHANRIRNRWIIYKFQINSKKFLRVIITIQRKWITKRLMRRYQSTLRIIVFVQSKFRMLKCRREFLRLRKTLLRVVSALVAKIHLKNFLIMKNKACVLQRWYRLLRNIRNCRKFVSATSILRKSVCSLRRRQLLGRAHVTVSRFGQSYYRGYQYRNSQVELLAELELKIRNVSIFFAARKIQCMIRQKLARKMYLEFKEGQIRILDIVHAWVFRYRNRKILYFAIKIQSLFRGMCGRRQVREYN